MNTTTLERVGEHARCVENKLCVNGTKRIFTALYGSQNYGVMTEYSDVDTKTLLLPSLRQTIFLPPLSTALHMPNGELAEVKDLREMFKQYRKQNINFLETLFSPYINVNPEFDKLFEALFAHRERIARYDPKAAVMSVCGTMIGTYTRYFKNPDEENAPKQLANLLRMKEFVERYLHDEDYEECIWSHQLDYLKAVRAGLYDFETASKIAEELAEWANQTMVYATQHLKKEPDKSLEVWMDELVYMTFLEHCEKD